MELYYCRAGEVISLLTSELVWKAQVHQFATGAAQGVDASRVVFAFARDNALPGSRWWKQINPYTQTPVNAVWLVMFCAGICGLLGFSSAAFISLAG
jgi:amino acid transporter